MAEPISPELLERGRAIYRAHLNYGEPRDAIDQGLKSVGIAGGLAFIEAEDARITAAEEAARRRIAEAPALRAEYAEIWRQCQGLAAQTNAARKLFEPGTRRRQLLERLHDACAEFLAAGGDPKEENN